MHKTRTVVTLLFSGTLLLSLLIAIDVLERSNGNVQVIQAAGEAAIGVELMAAHQTTSWDARDPAQERFALPVLFFHQNRQETRDSERTLDLNFTGIDGGKVIVLEIFSRHENIATGTKITVTQPFTLPDGCQSAEKPCIIRWTMSPRTTPGDFYTLRVKDATGNILWQNLYSDRPDFVVLDTWDVHLDTYTVRILYASLFPFAKGHIDMANRLAPAAVTDFIEEQFVPIITETWRTQFNVWGLGRSIHPAWDADNTMEIIVTDAPFALFDDHGTRSRFIEADGKPSTECRLWWASSNNSFQAYKSLVEATRTVYAHEFFHLVQRNILLTTEHPEHRWSNMFIEGQGKFAPSVQYPEIEVLWPRVRPIELSEYLVAANRFLTLRLNSSYQDIEDDPVNKYDSALYWRFLYEQYNNMDIVRTALVEMTRGYDDAIVPAIKQMMDRTFSQYAGPFTSFEDSLIAFARANYALRLPGGRCAEEDRTQCNGTYYDPSHLYTMPPLEAELDYDGSHLIYEGAIPASYGMDFVEINLDAADQLDAIQVIVNGHSDVSRFNVQVWPIKKSLPNDYVMTVDPIIMQRHTDGTSSYIFDASHTTQGTKLALIITRLDAGEATDPNGIYTVTVK